MSTTGHRDVATLEALTYEASRQLSTSLTTVDIHFRFDMLLIIFFPPLDVEMFENSLQYANKTLFSNNRIRYAATRSRRKLATANTRSEHFNIRDENDPRKRGRLIIPTLTGP